MATPACPPRGVYAPAVAFFHEDESLDLSSLKTHVTRLAKAGVAGLVIQGSNGEAPHLLHSERQEIISTASAILKEHGAPNAVIIAGCAGAMKPPAVQTFFNDVANASPIPILLYNFPAVTSGIDLDSDTIANLAQNANIVGCKLTCGNLGKLHRVANDSRTTSPFAAFAGKSDFFLHGLVAGSHGVIVAVANLVSKVHIKLLEYFDEGKLREAQELQTKLSDADWILVQLGVAGLKSALDRYYGYGKGISRKPLGMVESVKFEGRVDTTLKDLVELESSL